MKKGEETGWTFEKIAIIGLGLMGGSLGLAAKRAALAKTVAGYARREESRRQALAQKVVDQASGDIREVVQGADLVIYCLPILSIPELARASVPSFASGCVVTDVASTKVEMVAEFRAVLQGTKVCFVGSHPIAGSDQTGLDAARADLYEGAMVVVTPEENSPEPAVRKVLAFWDGLKALTTCLSPVEHDRIVARTSHLPHLVAAMLVQSVFSGKDPSIRAFCGSGFRDATRIAGGSETIWHDIVKTNRVPVSVALEEFAGVLAKVRDMIDRGDFADLRRFLVENRQRRMNMQEGS